MTIEWDLTKAQSNRKKHGISFADAAEVLCDEFAVTIEDSTSDEQRHVTIGQDALGRILVVVYTWRGDNIRLDLGTEGNRTGTCTIRGTTMKKEYDFSKGKRGAVIPIPPGKTRITIRLDNDLLDWFRTAVEAQGGGSYQALINKALHDYIENADEPLEDTIRKVLREELRRIA